MPKDSKEPSNLKKENPVEDTFTVRQMAFHIFFMFYYFFLNYFKYNPFRASIKVSYKSMFLGLKYSLIMYFVKLNQPFLTALIIILKFYSNQLFNLLPIVSLASTNG